MISVVTLANAHLYGGVLPSMFRLRRRSFIDRQGWNIPSWDGMEYDAYDNPATTYLIHHDDYGEALGVSRLYPTDRPYMLADIWPNLVQTMSLPASLTVWEGTRFCVEKTLPRELRRRIVHELVSAYLEFCLQNDIEQIIGVMPPGIWRAVFRSSGWKPEPLGPIEKLADGSKIYAAQLPVSNNALANVRRVTGINTPVLHQRTDDKETATKRAA